LAKTLELLQNKYSVAMENLAELEENSLQLST